MRLLLSRRSSKGDVGPAPGGNELPEVFEAAWHRAEEGPQILAGLGRLPDLEPLRRDLSRAGRVLGAATVNALSARAVRLFAAASRLVGRAIDHDLTQDRGFGRGDDGLGADRGSREPCRLWSLHEPVDGLGC